MESSTVARHLCLLTRTIMPSRPLSGPDVTTSASPVLTAMLIGTTRCPRLVNSSIQPRSASFKGTKLSPTLSIRVNSGIARSLAASASGEEVTATK